MLKTMLLSFIGSVALFVNNAHSGDFDNYPALESVITELSTQGLYNKEQLNDIFYEVERQQVALDLMNSPAEKVALWKDYRARFLTPRNINNGVAFWQKYREALEVAEQQFGVPQEIIVAILGVETRYGANKGRLKVIDSLTTLAFDFPRRSEYFTQELKNFLILSKEQGLDPLQVRGSYAGAMGYGQFMPSSWRKLAIDFDGDNKADLINNPIDAIGSIGNYFKENGWQDAPVIALQANASQTLNTDILSRDLKTNNTLGALKSQGLQLATELADSTPASAFSLEGDEGTEYWLGFNNFYVITTYNRSIMYAMAVFQLSQALKEAKKTAEQST